jgi:hypothetical protein
MRESIFPGVNLKYIDRWKESTRGFADESFKMALQQSRAELALALADFLRQDPTAAKKAAQRLGVDGVTLTLEIYLTRFSAPLLPNTQLRNRIEHLKDLIPPRTFTARRQAGAHTSWSSPSTGPGIADERDTGGNRGKDHQQRKAALDRLEQWMTLEDQRAHRCTGHRRESP